jgi:hypothetical protein
VPAGQRVQQAGAQEPTATAGVARVTAGVARTREPGAGDDLPVGAVVMPHGRVSAAREVRADPTRSPFTPVQLAALDEALTLASRSSGLQFTVYIGPFLAAPSGGPAGGRSGPERRAAAEALHAATPDPAEAVLVAVSPGERAVEVVTGERASRRLSNNGCRLAVMAMVASFKEGDLIGGLVSGLRMMSDQAGQAPRR